MVRVLVTGANGFAGTAICRHLMERGWAVRGAVRRAEAVVPAGAHKVVVGPLDGATDWQAALDGVDAVVHCAARVHVRRETKADPMAAFRRINVVATRHLAQQARAAGVQRFVFLSSVGAAVAEVRRDRASPYQRSKLEAEQALREGTAGGAMLLVMLRPPLLYG
ncbi:MAG TPA: NAD-dependent epimerase/dehydratase family protein, partial [Kiloniellaceae bacterium]